MLKPSSKAKPKTKKSSSNKTIKKTLTKSKPSSKSQKAKPVFAGINLATMNNELLSAKLSNLVNFESILKDTLHNTENKVSAPEIQRLSSSKENRIRLDFEGLSTPVTKISPPMRMISFGDIEHLSWWDRQNAVEKKQDYSFKVTVKTTSDESLTVSRTWSTQNKRKEFYVQDEKGRVKNLDDVDRSTMHLFFIEDALKESREKPIILCEGYRAAKHLRDLDINAVGTIDAGTLPVKEVLSKLESRQVILWPDNDDVGLRYMSQIRTALLALNIDADHLVQWHDGPKNGDAADIKSKEEIKELIKSSQSWPVEIVANITKPVQMKRVLTQLKLRSSSIIARSGR
ncbi:hypothetical protein [Agaribacterium sp. ZY112]|uniref:hypothetical protein n=1 Tax=Agaribacterium sp. ZY112 TaxID=3233574 RepID=UPI003525CEA6